MRQLGDLRMLGSEAIEQLSPLGNQGRQPRPQLQGFVRFARDRGRGCPGLRRLQRREPLLLVSRNRSVVELLESFADEAFQLAVRPSNFRGGVGGSVRFERTILAAGCQIMNGSLQRIGAAGGRQPQGPAAAVAAKAKASAGNSRPAQQAARSDDSLERGQPCVAWRGGEILGRGVASVPIAL